MYLDENPEVIETIFDIVEKNPNGSPKQTHQSVFGGVVETQEEQKVESAPEPVVEQKVQPVAQPEPQYQPKAPTDSFRELRDKTLRFERERDEALRRVQEMEQMRVSRPAAEDDDIKIGDDDIAEGKHLKALKNEVRKLKEEVTGYRQHSSMMSTEVRLKTQYPDFDRVVSQDNVDTLRALYPEIAQTLNSGSDLYATGVSAYTMIKKLGIHAEDTYVQEKALAHKNAAKPKPLVSVSPQQGDSPLSKANAFANGSLTDEFRAQMWKETNAARKGHL